MPGQEAYDYYGTSRGTRPGWVNRSAVMFFEPFLQFGGKVAKLQPGAI
jgi:hypothetical protein